MKLAYKVIEDVKTISEKNDKDFDKELKTLLKEGYVLIGNIRTVAMSYSIWHCATLRKDVVEFS